MFPATVDSSSDNVGEPATICWNSVSTLRCKASISEFFGTGCSGIDSTVARMNGVSCAYSVTFTRSSPSAKTNRLWFGMLHDFVHNCQAADSIQVGRLRRVDARFTLRHHHNRLVFS